MRMSKHCFNLLSRTNDKIRVNPEMTRLGPNIIIFKLA